MLPMVQTVVVVIADYLSGLSAMHLMMGMDGIVNAPSNKRTLSTMMPRA